MAELIALGFVSQDEADRVLDLADAVRTVGSGLKEDSSALFVLVRKAQPETVLAELSRYRGRLIRSCLSPEQEEKLRKALESADVQPGVSAAQQAG